MTPEERLQLAEKKKEEGNQFFKKNLINRAFRRYFHGAEILRFSEEEQNEMITNLWITCNLNMAACALLTKDYSSVVDLTSKILNVDKKNVKGFFRRAKAFFYLNEWEASQKDIDQGLQLDPTNSSLLQLLEQVKIKKLENDKKQKKVFSQIFKNEEPLYDEKEIKSLKEEPKTRVCRICGEEVESIQWARHVTKKHGNK